MPGGAYQVFAENVRRLSMKSGSLAEVCRKTSINRQQFNKYLSGATLPSKKVLQKLAGHFGVKEIELFQPEGTEPQQADANVALVNSILNHAKPSSDLDKLPCGMYRVYTKWQPDPRYYFVFAIEVLEQAGVTVCHWQYSFKGDTSRDEKQHSMWVRGLVYQDMGKISFVGKITKPKLPGLVMLNVDHDDRWASGVWAGIANVFLPNNIPFAGGVILEKQPADVSRLAIFRSSGVLSNNDESIPTKIKTLLDDKPQSDANHLAAIDLVERWRPPVANL